MSYNYVVTAQKPTAVNGCVTGEAAGDPGERELEGPRPREARGPGHSMAGPARGAACSLPGPRAGGLVSARARGLEQLLLGSLRPRRTLGLQRWAACST